MPPIAQLHEALAAQPRHLLANLPTPVHELRRLSAELGGPRLLVKRDDLTGLATGGNKTRKLEFLLADAIAHGADCVITAGGPQSNHCRQTAAAAASMGLQCHLVLGGDSGTIPRGNLFLDRLLGAEIHWTEKPLRNQLMDHLADQLKRNGKRPYTIPIGGSNEIGAIGYVAAMKELAQQLAELEVVVDEVVVATSSGGTQAGMALGAAITNCVGRVTGVSIDLEPNENFEQEIAAIANATAQRLNLDAQLSPDDVKLLYGYLGGGYGVVGDLERDAIHSLACSEGVLVGPVYTGRALGELIGRIRQGAFNTEQTILFWHTGDESALHGYVEDVLPGA